MTWIHPDILYGALSVVVSSTNSVHVCSASPTLFSHLSSMSLGHKDGVTVSAVSEIDNGRKITVPAIEKGTITGNGTAKFVVLADTISEKILWVETLPEEQNIIIGGGNNTFDLDSFDIIFEINIS